MTPHEHIEHYVKEIIEDTDCFLVDFKIKPTNNYKIFIDSDSGFTLEKALKITRSLRKKIEEAELYPEGDFSMEVSSPGIDTPLSMLRQYKKNIGRKVELELKDEEAEGIVARIIDVIDETITFEKILPPKRSKKIEVENPPILIPFSEIKQAIVCVEF